MLSVTSDNYVFLPFVEDFTAVAGEDEVGIS